jgi:hypothetical protein
VQIGAEFPLIVSYNFRQLQLVVPETDAGAAISARERHDSAPFDRGKFCPGVGRICRALTPYSPTRPYRPNRGACRYRHNDEREQ